MFQTNYSDEKKKQRNRCIILSVGGFCFIASLSYMSLMLGKSNSQPTTPVAICLVVLSACLLIFCMVKFRKQNKNEIQEGLVIHEDQIQKPQDYYGYQPQVVQPTQQQQQNNQYNQQQYQQQYFPQLNNQQVYGTQNNQVQTNYQQNNLNQQNLQNQQQQIIVQQPYLQKWNGSN